LKISRGARANPLYGAFLDASREAGHSRTDDVNGAQQEGFGDFEMTVNGGIRQSTARAYLDPIRHRSNLTVRSHCHVQRLKFSASRATGVDYLERRRSVSAAAAQEVVLCAGAIGSPQILLLSGIGDAEELNRVGISLHHSLPGVGRNLMDHLEVYFQQACSQPVSLNRWLNLAGKGFIGAQWLLTRRGLGATNHFEAGGFVRSAPDAPWPDIQFHFLPAAVSYDGTQLAAEHGFQVHIGPVLSPSRGRLQLRSADPADKPILRFNYMSTDEDWQVFRAAIRLARDIFAQPALSAFAGAELVPGASVVSDEQLDAFVREHAQSAYHPCGTCRMGDRSDAVVDSECRVHGLSGLRVVDSSIFPHITNGNLNAPTIMVAEKAADLIRGEHLAPEFPHQESGGKN
jgi:choline dehydrogenase